MTPWQPTRNWHCWTLGILLAGCIAVFSVLGFLAAQLPPPYQPRTTAQGTTPWK